MLDEKEREKCRYIADSDLPKLVLAVHDSYNFRKKEDWKYVVHQTAGHGCHNIYMLAREIRPRKNIKEKIQEISDTWLDSCWGMSRSPMLDDLLEYRKQLNNLLGVDCSFSYNRLEEGIYPIDCDEKSIKKLTSEKLPKDLDNLIGWKDNLEKCMGIIGRWNIYILGENCD
ncbi:hypothetical protein GF336_06345 [Candidatus Woesearchaeota archaeon]|nr:hypothetical protein [Candidatus Woesearchaeota archaeon]